MMGLRVEVVARPADDDAGALVEAAPPRLHPPARRLVVGEHQADRRVADLAGQLRAQVRVDERARVHEVDRSGNVEDLRPLEEERPQLGIEQREPLVDLDLRKVGLDLREVRVEREVGRQVRREAVLDVQAGLRVRAGADEPPRGVVDRLEADGGERRQELQVAARRQVRHPLEHAHLLHEAADVARHGRPDGVLLVLALDLPHDLEPPAVLDPRRLLRVAEALERNGHLGRVAVLDNLGPAVEQGVPRPVGDRDRAALLQAGVDHAVALHVVAVEVEVVAALLVHERVEVDRDQVVLPRRVAVDPVGAHDAGVGVVQVEAEVDVVAVVGDVHLRLLRGRIAVERRLLHELGEHRRRAPHLVVEAAVDVGRRVRADGAHPRASGERAIAASDGGRRRLVDARSIRAVGARRGGGGRGLGLGGD